MSPPASEPRVGIAPYLIVREATRALDWYQQALGATEAVRLADPSGRVMHAEILLNGSSIMVADEFPDMGYRSPVSLGGSPVSIMVYVDTVFARAIDAGAEEVMKVADQFDGDRRGTLRDPFGHTWLLATSQETVSKDELRRRFDEMMKQGS